MSRSWGFDLRKRPLIMGVLNVTPDSFSDGGQFFSVSEALARADQMRAEGADIIDVGGESTRPGAEPVLEDEELRRVIPVVGDLARRGFRVSIDTMKPAVASAALAAGAQIVNDVSGFRNPEMSAIAARHQAATCLMHMQGKPRTMQAEAEYADVVSEVRDYLRQQAEEAIAAGVPQEEIVLDPGIGFGKTLGHNIDLLKAIPQMKALGFPVLIGVSRKSFIGRLLGSSADPRPVEERLHGTLAVQVLAQAWGADVLRVHDVRAATDARAMVHALIASEDRIEA